MIGLEDRQALAREIEVAHAAGARLHLACCVAGIDVRTLQRWRARAGLTAGDGRPKAVRPMPSHALSAAERAALLAVANEPRFASVPPARIVPMLADEGVRIGISTAIGRDAPRKGLKKLPAEPAEGRSTRVWADSARNLGVCRLAAAGLEGL